MTIPVASKQDAETFNFFFFGTLMVPQILTRVLGHKGHALKFRDAILPGYVRHCVKGADYPGILPVEASKRLLGRELSEEESSVRGTYVSGLTQTDVRALDVFEGDEYTRTQLSIFTLTPAQSLANLSIDFTTPTTRAYISPTNAQQSIDAHEEGFERTEAWCYCWKDTTDAGVTALDAQVWDFQAFLTDKSHRWTGLPVSNFNDTPQGRDESEYADVDRHRALGGRTFPDQAETASENRWPEFGKGLRKYWKFDPDYINLNHGSYGSPPVPVIAAMHTISDECEKCPDLFMRKTYLPLMNDVRAQLARLVNAEVDDCVMVANASVAANTVMWNIDWQEGDVIVGYSTTYAAVKQTLKFVCDKYQGVTYHEIPLAFPETHDEIVRKTESVLKEYNGGAGARAQRVRMVVVDSIVSLPGVIMPWERIVDLCKEYDVLSLVDAAHHLGQLPVDLKQSQPDFWLSNCHKWLMSHRGCALFYVAKNRQHLIRSTLPTSHYYESAKYPATGEWVFAKQWDWVGTQDMAPMLSVSAALEFRRFLGGEERISKYCHDLAVTGGRKVAEFLKTNVVDTADGELTANMVTVELPLAVSFAENTPEGKKEMARQYDFLLEEMFKAKVFAAVFCHNKKWMARFSAQVWNDVDDFIKVAGVLQAACNRVG
ncbi:hypothetical protein NliqN6_1666 [Naganishia liquefaciens]|uniref:Aminotransferase class V-fold PLP-dependent enzyme n=1 Tax=Naganishia liquefaciens TaxID=104408 RepID=A0A8H3TS62_9TREE|nr:hypothetical protein NliqN6_1666 [Naganishia liquefaciens]